MKHKFVKITVIAAIALLAAGGMCLGAGLAMGGSPSFYYDEEGIHVKENAASDRTQNYVMQYTKLDALKNLDISLFDADLKIVSGKEWAVEYVLDGSRMEPEYSLEGQTLIIRENQGNRATRRRFFWWGDYWWQDGEQGGQAPYVKLTVPENAKLEEVLIASEYGDVSIEKKLKAQNVSIDMEYGEMKLNGWEGDAISFVMEYGDLTAGNLEGASVDVKSENGAVKTGNLEADTITFDMTYGDLTTGTVKGEALAVNNETGKASMDALQVENAAFEMEYGDLSAAVDAIADLTVESESGSVTLKLIGGMEKYGVSLHTDYGAIRTPQGTVEADEYEGCSDFIRLADDTAGIRIYTESGDIRVREDA